MRTIATEQAPFTKAMETRRKMVRDLDTVAGVIFTLAAIAIVAYVFTGREGFDFLFVRDNLDLFVGGLWITVYATSVSYVVGMGLGFLIGWARSVRVTPLERVLAEARGVGRDRPTRMRERARIVPLFLVSGTKYYARRVADAYVEIIRGTPVYVQILFAWSVLLVNFPTMDERTLIAGIAALTANTAGYQGEIFRAGLQTVHSGQVEAARAIGLSRWGAMRHVVLPQALRLIVPPLTNEYIGLLKVSSLLTVVGVAELMNVARNLAFGQAHVFEIFAMVVGIYLLITVPLSKVVQYLEVHFRIPGMGIQSATRIRE